MTKSGLGPSKIIQPKGDSQFKNHIINKKNVAGVFNNYPPCINGPDRDLNPGPLAPEARIIPLDHQAMPLINIKIDFLKIIEKHFSENNPTKSDIIIKPQRNSAGCLSGLSEQDNE